MNASGEPEPVKTRLRIRFTKCDDLRWIGHRDLARVWERLLRRVGLELAFSQGFHPKARISFPSALALGIEALDEIVEMEVLGQVGLEQLGEEIRREMPAGMELLSLESPEYGLGKAKVAGASYRIEVPEAWREGLAEKIGEVTRREMIEIVRDEKKTIRCESAHEFFNVCLDEQFLMFSIPSIDQGSIRPSELLELIGLSGLLDSGATLQRTQVHLREPVA